MRNLLILGAGQYGMVAKEVAEDMACFEKISFLDDNNLDAVGKFSDYESLRAHYSDAIVAFGNSVARLEWIEKLIAAGYHVPILIHSKSHVSFSAQLGNGCVVEPMAVVNPYTAIGVGCIISAGAVVNHNSVVGDGCHIDCNATVRSNQEIAPGIKIECGEVV